MSDALAYLVKARPDALGPYFKFLKQCGRHLDPKTRNLISVITKVHAQTERGLKQYLTRALREGCTPMEILDALLMAFPALGLAKIVWATDVILAMDLPGFSLEALQDTPTWHDLIALDELGAGETRRIECDGRAVFVHRGEDGPRVYDSRCPHQGTDIPHLALNGGGTLTCPKHEWAFDLGSGACIRTGDTPLTRWECRVAGGRILARW
jgi:nitrite reductase/ring-hydroxylating ferredoxin subunit/alkylhydroperoxidase/carboxymuconolactone decarboxylase family protein YurZ